MYDFRTKKSIACSRCLPQGCRKEKTAPLLRCRESHRHRKPFRLSATDDDGPTFASSSGGGLQALVRRKMSKLSSVLSEFSEEDLIARLGGEEIGSLTEQGIEHRLAGLIPDVRFRKGRPVLALEMKRSSPAATSEELADLAKQYEEAGCDAIVVSTDEADSPSGLGDLLLVCRAVRIPVIMKDWILHPLQIKEAKEAGAAGVLGIVTSIVGARAALLSSYAASIGLDCPVEVVNADEVDQMEKLGIPFFGCNLSVGLSLAIPGFRSDVARGILEKLPFGASSMVGVTSMQEAVQAKEAGADMMLIKSELLSEISVGKPINAGPSSRRKALLQTISELEYRLSGDD